MCCYRVFRFAVVVMLVCFAVVAQADTQLLTNPGCVVGDGGWAFTNGVSYGTAAGGETVPNDIWMNGLNCNPPYLDYVTNMTTHSIAAGEQFSVAWDAASDGTASGVTNEQMTVSLFAQQPNLATGGVLTPIVSQTIDLGISGTWASYDGLGFTAAVGADYLGKTIGVQFYLSNPAGGHNWAAFTNVNLNLTTVPEPNALALLVAGIVSLLAYAWRKRK